MNKRFGFPLLAMAIAGTAAAQTAASLSPSPNLQFFDTSAGIGIPCVNCTLSTFAAGTNTPLRTYTDYTLTSQNPVVITLNSQGYSTSGIWIGAQCYKYVLANALGSTVWSQDHICDNAQLLKALLAGATGSGQLGYEYPGSNTAQTVQAKLQQVVSTKDFGAKCDGVTDDTAAFNTTLQSAISSGFAVSMQPGTCLVNTATAGVILNFNSSAGMTIRGAGSALTKIKTTTASADLFAAISSVAAIPTYTLEGFTLLGPDFSNLVTICSTSTSGNGLRISGTAGPKVGIHDVIIYGFCGSGKSGLWLDNVEDSHLSRVESQLNEYGARFTTAFNGNGISGMLLGQNATRGLSCEDCQNDTFDGLVVQSNKKTGIFLTHSTANVFNGCHLETNNTSATAGVFGIDLRGTSGNFVLGNTFNGCVFQGTHETIGLTGVSGGNVTTSNQFIGGLASSVPNPFVISSGAFGAATFVSLTGITGMNDPQFASIVINDTADGNNYYPNGSFTGYTKGSRVLTGTTGNIGGSALDPAGTACAFGTVAIAGAAAGDQVSVQPTTYASIALNPFYFYGYVASANTAVAVVCAVVAGTPPATTYKVSVFK